MFQVQKFRQLPVPGQRSPFPPCRQVLVSVECRGPPSGGASSSRALAQQQADAVDVEGHDGKRHHAGKAVGPEGADPIETALLEIVDRRFHRRVLPAHGDEHLVLLAFPVGLRGPSLARQHVVIKQLVEPNPVGGAVEPAVEAAHAKVGEACLGTDDHRLGVVDVAALPHDLVVQDEAVVVFQKYPVIPGRP